MKAEFIKFNKDELWVTGKVDDLVFNAKLFDEGSEFGMNNGRVSKLSIWDENKPCGFFEACIVNFDRGWDIKPKEAEKPYFDAVMDLLENSPKRL